jgi:CheY-like chemotaxis protein
MLDGNEVAARLRSVPGMHRAVLVVLTGDETTKDIEPTLIAGFQHHLTKPVDLACIEALFAKIGPSASAALVAPGAYAASRSLHSV